MDSQNKLNGNFLFFIFCLNKIIEYFSIVPIDNMLKQNTSLVDDLTVILNKISDHNNTTVDIFSNMKKQVNLYY